MKPSIFLFLFLSVLTANLAFAQCNMTSISVSASDVNYVQLYHAGLFLIPNGDQNVCDWEVTTLEGELVHTATTSGNFEEQSFMYFEHNVPITDSMQVVLAITNEVEGIICTITDTLYWDSTEIFPGIFVENWAILGDYGGDEEQINSILEDFRPELNVVIYPSPTSDVFFITGDQAVYNLAITDARGSLVVSRVQRMQNEAVDVSAFAPGLYLVHFMDELGQFLGSRKLVKQ